MTDTRTLSTEWDNPIRHACEGSCPGCLRDWSNTGFHPILDWRLAADALDLLLDRQFTTDRWASRRTAAVRGVTERLRLDHPRRRRPADHRHRPRPHRHRPPFAPIDGQLTAGIPTPHGPALPFDVFNFDRRSGEVYRRL